MMTALIGFWLVLRVVLGLLAFAAMIKSILDDDDWDRGAQAAGAAFFGLVFSACFWTVIL